MLSLKWKMRWRRFILPKRDWFGRMCDRITGVYHARHNHRQKIVLLNGSLCQSAIVASPRQNWVDEYSYSRGVYIVRRLYGRVEVR